MCPIAIGRKNWIHVGSAQAGPKIAAIRSVVESCRRLKLPIRAYFAAVLPGLANRSVQRLDHLTAPLGPTANKITPRPTKTLCQICGWAIASDLRMPPKAHVCSPSLGLRGTPGGRGRRLLLTPIDEGIWKGTPSELCERVTSPKTVGMSGGSGEGAVILTEVAPAIGRRGELCRSITSYIGNQRSDPRPLRDSSSTSPWECFSSGRSCLPGPFCATPPRSSGGLPRAC
jgi:hypothetical protein